MKPSRRDILKLSVVGAGFPIVARAEQVAFADAQLAVFDERFAAARSFATKARLAGLEAIGFRGDVGRLWMEQLHRQWAQPRTVIGLTTPGALFCLATLAQDRGMRIAVRDDRTSLVGWTLAPRS